jgi:release factor glutamine methyltransferase
MPNVSETLNEAAAILQKSAIADSRREAASLLAEALRRDKIFLVAHSEYELSFEEEKRFRDFIARRARREPFQYIVGRQEFYGLDFAVTKDVLIPRPETEMIVEAAIEILQAKVNSKFCEVGIGSGCIAVSILHQVETANAIGLDISEQALAVARRNAEKHRVLKRLELRISNIFENLPDGKLDLIASNPPYIPRDDIKTLQAEVRDFEPRAALTDGGGGLSIIEKIIVGAPRFLKPSGFLLMEIGINQANAVEAMFDNRVWRGVEILPDFQGILRTVKAKKVEK